MFQHVTAFCRRLFSSKGFRRGLRIFFWVFVAYCLYNVIIFLAAMMYIGVSFREALRFFFDLPFIYGNRIPASASVALGIAAGLVWYFNRKRKNSEEAEPDEKAEDPSGAVREEETIETTHYRYH